MRNVIAGRLAASCMQCWREWLLSMVKQTQKFLLRSNGANTPLRLSRMQVLLNLASISSQSFSLKIPTSAFPHRMPCRTPGSQNILTGWMLVKRWLRMSYPNLESLKPENACSKPPFSLLCKTWQLLKSSMSFSKPSIFLIFQIRVGSLKKNSLLVSRPARTKEEKRLMLSSMK